AVNLLIPDARRVWNSLIEQTQRPPGRVKFARALQDQGMDVSARQVRDLVQRLGREEESRGWMHCGQQ
ncbi:MAG: hypothetical protein U0840_29575, partial [Gemmataceae bacterium]